MSSRSHVGMAVSSATRGLLYISPASETSLRIKIKGQNVIARVTSSLFTLTYYFICGYGGIGSFENERTLWVIKRVRKGAETRRIASGSEQGDYVSRVTRGAAAPNYKFNMRVWRNWQTR